MKLDIIHYQIGVLMGTLAMSIAILTESAWSCLFIIPIALVGILIDKKYI